MVPEFLILRTGGLDEREYISFMFLEKIVNSRHNNVVAAEPGDGTALLFIRENDKITEKTIPFHPFILMNNPALLNGSNLKCDIHALSGTAPLSYLAKFPDTATYEEAEKFLKKNTGFSQSSPNAPYRIFNDYMQQLLVSEEFRLFRKMNLGDTRRLQFDIETYTSEGYEFPNPQRENDRIIIISMSDSTGWEKVLNLEPMSEKELLEEFVKTIRERDPDVIEGYNIFRFDLPFIEERAKRHKVKLSLGRKDRLIKKRNSRFSAAERTINYTRYDIYGRHVVDMYHLVQFYDISHRDLESYGLKAVAKHFGVAAEHRTYVEGNEIKNLWNSDRERLLKYAMDDARETRSLSNILSPSYFYQAQLVPMKYQDCVVRGNATRIDAMLVAAYLEKKQSIPVLEQSRAFSGALTKAFSSGVFKNVWHCDVRSLYPSIILAEKWCPSRDALGIFPKFLEKLRLFRLEAKDAEKKADTPESKDYFNALQTTFKILINSFYGYLGFSQGTFNDYDMAEKVTTRGREILTMMLDYLEKSGAKVIEMDTDGIYFQPPAGVDNPSLMQKMIQEQLPAGIEVELDEKYPAMFCYKSKNYALLMDSGEISVTGAALKSRGLEAFQRNYIRDIISMLLSEKPEAIERLSSEYRKKIQERAFPLTELSKSETLSDSLETYKKKMSGGDGRRSAAYELAIKSGRDYRQGDQVSFYVIGQKKKVSVFDNSRLVADAPPERDENIEYYLSKLDELNKKFSEFIPQTDSEDENPLGLTFD